MDTLQKYIFNYKDNLVQIGYEYDIIDIIRNEIINRCNSLNINLEKALEEYNKTSDYTILINSILQCSTDITRLTNTLESSMERIRI